MLTQNVKKLIKDAKLLSVKAQKPLAGYTVLWDKDKGSPIGNAKAAARRQVLKVVAENYPDFDLSDIKSQLGRTTNGR
jgi:hypothetical protein